MAKSCRTPIVIPQSEWCRIRARVDAPGDPGDRRRTEYVERLDRLSREMTRQWPNSLENVNKRNEEMRQARIAAAEKANEDFYVTYLKKQAEEQRRLMEQAKDTAFRNKDAPKMLLSAVLECATQHERAAQLDFKKTLQAEEDEREREYAEQIKKESSGWLEMQSKKKEVLFRFNKEHQKQIAEQRDQLAERLKAEREEELRLEMLDDEKAKQQMQQIADCERIFRETEKKRILADMEQASREVARRVREEEERDCLDEKLRNIYLDYKHAVDCRRAQTEAEIRAEHLRVLAGISQKLKTGTEERDRKEQEILDKALRQQEEIEIARVEADRRHLEESIEDRKEQRRQYLIDEAQKKHEEETFKKWQMLNRFKSEELTKVFEQKIKEAEWRRTLEHREELIAQWKERDERDAKEKEDRRYFYGELMEKSLREADNKLLRHAALLCREAKDNGWPWLPLHKAVERYRKLYSLFPARPLPKPLQEHLQGYAPEDRTCPKEVPEPPPPNYDRMPKRYPTNGLQDRERERCLPSRTSSEEYKRLGPQNGLQAKPEDKAQDSETQGVEWRCYQGEMAARRLRQAEDDALRQARVLRREAEHGRKKGTLADAVQVKVLQAVTGDYRRQGKVNGLQQKPPNVVLLPPKEAAQCAGNPAD